MDAHDQLDLAIDTVMRARKVLKKGTAAQVRSAEDRDHMKTVATLWFNRIRPSIVSVSPESELQAADQPFEKVFNATAKAATRSSYITALAEARKALLVLRSAIPLNAIRPEADQASNYPPNFSPLAADLRMQQVIQGRWQECLLCINAKAHLAAIVMMGGLLESLFVSRANRLTDKSPLVSAKRAPQKKGKTQPLQEWTLNSYIEVGHELGWISQTAKDVGMVLRDYRNFIHPQQEYAHQVTLSEHDAVLMWDVTKSLVRQLLAS